jgi:hypothetical protein
VVPLPGFSASRLPDFSLLGFDFSAFDFSALGVNWLCIVKTGHQEDGIKTNVATEQEDKKRRFGLYPSEDIYLVS